MKVDFIKAFPGEDITAYIQGVRNGMESDDGERLWFLPPPGRPDPITTDEQGRFRLAGVGRERLIRFELEGPGIQATHVFAATRGTEKPGETVLVKRTNGYDDPLRTVRLLASPSRPIRGILREKATGRPIAGAIISDDQGGTLRRATSDAPWPLRAHGISQIARVLGHGETGRGTTLLLHAAQGLRFRRPRAARDRFRAGPRYRRSGTVDGWRDGQAGQGRSAVLSAGDESAGRDTGAPRHFLPTSQSVTDAEGNYAVVVLPGPGGSRSRPGADAGIVFLPPASIDRS